MDDLKPCAFCGGEALMISCYLFGKISVKITCRQCKKSIIRIKRKCAIKAWNEREKVKEIKMTYEQLVSLCKRERIRKHISLTELEKISGVRESTLSKFENHPEKRSIYALMPYIENGIIIIYGATVNEKR